MTEYVIGGVIAAIMIVVALVWVYERGWRTGYTAGRTKSFDETLGSGVGNANVH